MKIFTAVITLVLIMMWSGLAVAQTDNGGGGGGGTTTTPTTTEVMPIIDAELAARIFLEKKVTYFIGSYGFTNPNGAYGVFHLNMKLQVTYLALYKDWMDSAPFIYIDTARGDKALNGLPISKSGACQDYSAYINGYTVDGQRAVTGSFYTPLLLAKDPLKFELEPDYKRMFVPYALMAGQDAANMRLLLDGNITGWYDPYLGGFAFYIDTLAGIQPYEIYDVSTGIVYVRDQIGYAYHPADTAPESMVNLKYKGGPIPIEVAAGGYRNYESQKLDARVKRDEQMVPAAVYMTDSEGSPMSVWAVGVTPGSHLQARAWVSEDQSDMPVIQDAEAISFGGPDSPTYGWTQIQLPAGCGKWVITFTGAPTFAPGFQLSVQRGNGGGGKGSPAQP